MGERRPLQEILAAYERDRADGVHRGGKHYVALYERLRESSDITLQEAQDPPQSIGPYDLEFRLGQGGQGTVWAARDRRLGRRVALKVLNASGARLSTLHFERFRREAMIASRLDHPGICPVLEVGVHEDVPFIAMRHVEGTSLAAMIQRRQSDVAAAETRERHDEALRLIASTALAVHSAHEAGVIHRDLKPANIMVTGEGVPVVLDFGLARDEHAEDLATLTRTGDVFGTPAYMSPEQASGDSLDRRTDVWSLGVMLVELLTLERPFQGATRDALFREIRENGPLRETASERRWPKDLRTVIETALAKDRDRRYQTAAAFAADLLSIQEGRAIAARAAGPLERLWRFSKRNPVTAGSLTVALLSLMVGLLVALVQRDHARQTLANFANLSDGIDARALVESFDVPWPATPEQVPAMIAWLDVARPLRARYPTHLRHREEIFALDSGLPLELADEMIAWMERLLPLVPKMETRLSDASTLTERSLLRPRDLWSAALSSLAQSEAYAGLTVVPNLGLVPLGFDPKSGLFEFAHLQSGEVPTRDAEGHLIITAASSIVLVLVPGSERALLGHQALDPKGPRFVNERTGVRVEERETPIREVRIAPFFISKYELTQGQYLRVMGSNPSHHGEASPHGVTPCHPVESLTYDEAKEVARRYALQLPSEAEWEYAARGGTDDLFFTGDDAPEAMRADNVRDQSASRVLKLLSEFPVDDGFGIHGPVTLGTPNPFGLHCVIGNVSEWTLERYVDRSLKVAADGSESTVPTVVQRGGNFGKPIRLSYHAYRNPVSADVRAPFVGVRLARALDR